MNERLESGQQDHEKRGPPCRRQLLQAPAQVGVQDSGQSAALECRRPLRARQICHQFRHRRIAVEMAFPILELILERLVGEPLPLPGRVVEYWTGNSGNRAVRVAPPAPCKTVPPIRGTGYSRTTHRPRYGAGSAPADARWHRRAPATPATGPRTPHEVKRPPDLLANPPFGLGQTGRFNHAQLKIHLTGNHLHRRLPGPFKPGAQRLVAGDDAAQSLLQRGHIQRARQARDRGHVIKRAVRLELVEKPQALLGKGEQTPGLALEARRRRSASLARFSSAETGGADSARAFIIWLPFLPIPTAVLPLGCPKAHPGDPIVFGRAMGGPGRTAISVGAASWRSSTARAMPAMVGASKTTRTGNSTRKARATREIICVASSECPPR